MYSIHCQIMQKIVLYSPVLTFSNYNIKHYIATAHQSVTISVLIIL